MSRTRRAEALNPAAIWSCPTFLRMHPCTSRGWSVKYLTDTVLPQEIHGVESSLIDAYRTLNIQRLSMMPLQKNHWAGFSLVIKMSSITSNLKCCDIARYELRRTANPAFPSIVSVPYSTSVGVTALGDGAVLPNGMPAALSSSRHHRGAGARHFKREWRIGLGDRRKLSCLGSGFQPHWHGYDAVPYL